MASLLKNTASQNVTFGLVSASTGAALTGATVTVYVTKDGTQTVAAGTVTELKVSGTGYGGYNFAPTQADTNGTDIGYLFVATGAIPVNLDFHTDAVVITGDPYAYLTTNLGALGANLSDVSANVVQWKGSTAPAMTGDAYAQLNTLIAHAFTYDGNNLPKIDVVDWLGTAVVAMGGKGGLPILDATNGTQLQGFGAAEVYVGIDHIGTTATGNPTAIGAYIGNATAAIGVSAGGKITEVVTVDTTTAVTNNVNAVLANTAHGGSSATLQLGSNSNITPALNINNSAATGTAVSIGASASGGIALAVNSTLGDAVSIIGATAGVIIESTANSSTSLIIDGGSTGSKDVNLAGDGLIHGGLTGTVGTVTNLTNAPTAGDLTATMKTSVTAAVPSAATIATAVAAAVPTDTSIQADAAAAIAATIDTTILNIALGNYTNDGGFISNVVSWDGANVEQDSNNRPVVTVLYDSNTTNPAGTAANTAYGALKPSGTLATVTNLTNAPTAGDLTATMKASVTAAVPSAAAIATAVAAAVPTDTSIQADAAAAILATIDTTRLNAALGNYANDGGFISNVVSWDGANVEQDSNNRPVVTVLYDSNTTNPAGTAALAADGLAPLASGTVSASPAPTTTTFTPSGGYSGIIPASGYLTLAGVQYAYTWDGTEFHGAFGTAPTGGAAWVVSAVATQAAALTILTQANKIGTNAADSPNAVTEQTQVASLVAISGTGPYSITVTCETITNTPVTDATVWLTSDPNGLTFVSGKVAVNGSGVAAFSVPSLGTYYAWRASPTTAFTNPLSCLVTG